MKSYLSLIPISARVRRRQNRLTRLCIVFAVFMVTAIFSMAEMGARMEQTRLYEKHGALSYAALFDTSLGQTLLLTAGVMFLLVLAAGVLMIASSINSSVAQRTQFFGMMRCIGMSRRQIIRFVRLEALNWCKTAVPAGLALGVLASWALCAVLRFLVGEEFSQMPLFGISALGLASGALVGVVAVLLAARTPARRAARVSPAAAVSGQVGPAVSGSRGMRLGAFRVETALGIHHALAARKSLVLTAGSFALSIVLFLSFLVLIAFVDHLMPQSVAAADIEIVSADAGNSIDSALAETLGGMQGVRRVYGRRSCFSVPAELSGAAAGRKEVDLVAFDAFDLQALRRDGILRGGSELDKVYGDSRYVLATWDKYSAWEKGDTVRVAGETLTIAGLLSYDPFNADGLTGGKMTLITSGETFARLTGETGYSLLMIQTEPDVTDADVAAIRTVAEQYGLEVNDRRGQRTSGTYTAFVACVYAFLGVLTLVTVLNIVNGISMSVTARTRQYGAMRAVGMDGRQLTRMILAESGTCAFWGCVVGCAVGLPLHRALYGFLILARFPYATWRWPVGALAVILLVVAASALLAAWAPARRMRTVSVTETINEL